jgi:hypothetical protein
MPQKTRWINCVADTKPYQIAYRLRSTTGRFVTREWSTTPLTWAQGRPSASDQSFLRKQSIARTWQDTTQDNNRYDQRAGPPTPLSQGGASMDGTLPEHLPPPKPNIWVFTRDRQVREGHIPWCFLQGEQHLQTLLPEIRCQVSWNLTPEAHLGWPPRPPPTQLRL